MEQNPLIKLAVVCRSPLLRASFKLLLQTQPDFEVISETATLEQTLVSSEIKPQIVLFNLSSDNEFELDTASSVLSGETQIIVLTNSNNFELNQKILGQSVRGSVSKTAKSAALFKAIRKVVEGEFWFERAVLSEVIRNLFKEKSAFYENPELLKIALLTPREKEVILLVGQGLKNKGIAERLFISENTVRHHLGSIFEKLNVSNRLELVVYALKHNVIRLS